MRSNVPSLCSGGIFDWDRALLRLDELNAKAEDPDLWNKPIEAQKMMRERTHLESAISTTRKLEQELEDAITLANAFEQHRNVEGALNEYELARRPVIWPSVTGAVGRTAGRVLV